MEVSNLVVLKTDEKKIIYFIDEIINTDKVYISGLHYRIRKIVALNDIRPATTEEVENEVKKTDKYFLSLTNVKKRSNINYLLGTVLHIDGDQKYLDKCLQLYKEIGVFSNGLTLKESSIHEQIQGLILKLNPDIIVITGHDVYNQKGLKELENYNNSLNYVKAVRKIRQIKSRGDVVVVAGACQSNFEALIASGADFASSPKRINIHTFDPAVIAIKAATTAFDKKVNLSEALRYIEKGSEAFGGLETYGKMKLFV
ncbi:MAG: sporulation peptidase YabG [Bacilli bacterium]|nr:sporulation peptidase YabG [Bacilli bacterium]